jgi:hypothetical protein
MMPFGGYKGILILKLIFLPKKRVSPEGGFDLSFIINFIILKRSIYIKIIAIIVLLKVKILL